MKMHDFYLTIPFGVLMMVSGIIAFIVNDGSTILDWGIGAGFVLLLASMFSIIAFDNKENSYFAFFLETVTAIGLTYVMGKHCMETSEVMPAGLVAAISAFMTAFYIYKIATGGNRFPPPPGYIVIRGKRFKLPNPDSMRRRARGGRK